MRIKQTPITAITRAGDFRGCRKPTTAMANTITRLMRKTMDRRFMSAADWWSATRQRGRHRADACCQFRNVVATLFLLGSPLATRADDYILFNGMCDASAAVALDEQLFVVADDEENVLRIYGRTGGDALVEVALNAFLSGGGKAPEADLEGGAMIGDFIFWIGSHGLSEKGNIRPGRQVFFATRVDRTGGGTKLQPVGRVYRHLISSFAQDQRLDRFHLEYAATIPPKEEDGLNIEGLTATPDGHLLIGFRNPIPDGKALLIPLLNPVDVIEDSPARLGDPILLDLGGLGIRSIGYHKDRYLIVAGAIDGGKESRLYEWKGAGHTPTPVEGISLAGLNPEGISFQLTSGRTEYLVLSDDGRKTVAGQDCKTLSNPEQKHFRGTVLSIGSEPPR